MNILEAYTRQSEIAGKLGKAAADLASEIHSGETRAIILRALAHLIRESRELDEVVINHLVKELEENISI